MKKIVIVVSDNGTTIKIDDAYTISLLDNSDGNIGIRDVIQFKVNGQYLDSDQTDNYLKHLAHYRSPLIISNANKQFLQETLSGHASNLPHSARLLQADVAPMRQISPVEAMEDIVYVMEHYIYDTLTELLKNHVDHQASASQLLRLRQSGLSNRAFKQAHLTRLCNREIAHALLGVGEKISLYGGMTEKLFKGIHDFEEKHPNQLITEWDIAKIGAEVGLNTYFLKTMHSFFLDSKLFASFEGAVYRRLTLAVNYFGVSTLPPLAVPAITLLTLNFLTYKFGDSIWDGLKTVAWQIKDGWKLLPTQLGSESKLEIPTLPGASLLIPTPSIPIPNLVTVPINNAKPNITATNQAHDDYSHFHLLPEEIFGSEAAPGPFLPPAKAMGKKDTELAKFQRSIREYLEKKSVEQNRLFPYDPRVLLPKDAPPRYAPGECGSLAVNCEGGKWNYKAKVDPIKSPQTALPLLAAHLLFSYFRGRRLSPAEKSIVTFREQLINLQAAREKDWKTLSIAFKRLGGNSYNDLEKFYRNKVRTQIKVVIDANSNDPSIVAIFKNLHFALENNENLFDSLRSPGYEATAQSCDQSLREKNKRFYQQLAANDITGAKNTAEELMQFHPCDVNTHLAEAEFHLQQKNVEKAEVSLQQADIYQAREEKLAHNTPNKVIETGLGECINTKEESIQRAKLLHENVNQTKFHFHLVQYQEARDQQKPACLQRLLNHTQVCLKENPDSLGYLDNQVNALLVANKVPEAIAYQKTVCNLSRLATDYYQLGNLYEQTADLRGANKAYEQGLQLPHERDSETTYHILLRVRDNYLELKDNVSALPSAKKIYKSRHADRMDCYLYGALCFEQGDVEQSLEALEKFVNAKSDNVSEQDNTFRSDAYFKLGSIYEKKGEVDKAIISFKSGLDIDGNDASALNSYSNLLHKKYGVKITLKKELLKENPNEERQQCGTQLAKKHLDFRPVCLKKFGLEVGFRLLNVSFDYFSERYFSRNVRKNLYMARLAGAVFCSGYETLYNRFSHGNFLPKKWEKMRSGERVSYGAGKVLPLFQLADALLEGSKYQIPQEGRNAVHCVQLGLQSYVGYDYIVNTSWQNQQIYQYIGDYAPYACGAAFFASCGISIGEGLVRGTYRALYGKYSPHYENHAYLFLKEFSQDLGKIVGIGLSDPDSVKALWELIEETAKKIPGNAPPEVLAIVGALIVIGGVATYAYNHSWYDKLSRMKKNAIDLATEQRYTEAITKLNDCITHLKSNEDNVVEIKKGIASISEQRLIKDIKVIRDKKENANLTKELISACETHLKDAPDDHARRQQLNNLQLLELIQENKCTEAMSICDERLKANTNDATAYRYRAQLHFKAGNLIQARADANQLRRLEPDDPLAHQHLATIEVAEGNLITGKEYLQTALDLFKKKTTSDSDENNETIAHQESVSKQLEQVDSAIAGRLIQNTAQCFNSALHATVSVFTAFSEMKKAHLRKPPLPFWSHCDLVISHEEEKNLISVGEVEYSQTDNQDFITVGETEFFQTEDVYSDFTRAFEEIPFSQAQQFWSKPPSHVAVKRKQKNDELMEQYASQTVYTAALNNSRL